MERQRARRKPDPPLLVDEAKDTTMAGGWTRDGAVQDQIEDTVKGRKDSQLR
jgi:hypothetical protein